MTRLFSARHSLFNTPQVFAADEIRSSRTVAPAFLSKSQELSTLLLEKVTLPNSRVVLVMRDVPYLDSAAIEGLLSATEELADRAMILKLANVPQSCREVLEMTGVSGRFSFFEDVQDAVRSFL